MVEGEVCVAFLGPREIQKRMTFGVVMGLATVVRGCCWCSHLPVRPHQHDTGTAPGWSITTDAARSDRTTFAVINRSSRRSTP